MAEMNLHILVPFSRHHLYKTLTTFWGPAADNGVMFHPILHDALHPIQRDYSAEPYVLPLYCGEIPKGWNEMYWKLNYFLDQMPIYDNHRYGFLCDDDAFEPTLYRRVQACPDDVVICSMKRGRRTPPGAFGHPPTALIAQKENMKIGQVGMEQLFVRGSIIKSLRFKNFHEADGDMIVNIVNNHPVKYLNDAFIWFNYLEPGRWW